MKKKKEKDIKWLMETDLPLAGKGFTYTKSEWKRIFGYDIFLVPGAKFKQVN